jgi:hypothetical protein
MLVYSHPKTFPLSPAAAQHDRMCDDDDGSMGAVVSPPTLPTSALNCLVVDSQRLASSPADLAQFNRIRNAVLSWQEMIASVQKWLPALEGDGLVTVLSDAHFSRLHLHFKDHSSLARALKVVPFLVRCCVPAQAGGAWGAHSSLCTGLTRVQQPEALHFITVEEKKQISRSPRLAADQDGFQQHHAKHNKRRRTAQESGEHSEEEQKAQTPRKAAKEAAAKQQGDAISISSSDTMEEQ